MHAAGITANLSVADLAEARDFLYGLSISALKDSTWAGCVNLHSPDGRAVVQLVTRDATSPVDSVISVHVGDEVEAAYEEAQRRGFEIVPSADRGAVGMRRFFVRCARRQCHGSRLSATRTKTANSRKPCPRRSSGSWRRTSE